MATFYGVEATKATNSIPQLQGQGTAGGGVKIAYDKYAPAGALSLGDKIKMGKLPKGARVIAYWLKSSDLGTVGTLDLGWSASADAVEAGSANGMFSAVDVHTAAITVDHGDQENMAGLGKKFDAGVDIEVKASAATDAAGTIECCVFYVVD